jgi:hypothetical protein
VPDGALLHLRDTYPIETAWAPQWVGDELRQVRLGAREARLAAIRAEAEAKAAAGRGDEHDAASQQALAASYQAMHEAYRDREAVFATTMADRFEWEQATRQQRHLAIAADAELRRRHPDHRFPLCALLNPSPATQALRDELTMTVGEEINEAGQWIKDLAGQWIKDLAVVNGRFRSLNRSFKLSPAERARWSASWTKVHLLDRVSLTAFSDNPSFVVRFAMCQVIAYQLNASDCCLSSS